MSTTDRHKRTPKSIRLPDALGAWVEEQSAATGKAEQRIIIEAVEQAQADLGERAGKAAEGLERRLALIEALSDHGARRVLAYLAGHDPDVFDAVMMAAQL